MSIIVRTPLIIAVGLLLSPPAVATFGFRPSFPITLVLQRDSAVTVWGWADPDETVTVAIGGQTKTATPGAGGKWQVKLDKLAAGGPHTLTVKGKNTLAVNDVLVGEVWLASGQSNMGSDEHASTTPTTEQAAAKLPQVRMFTVPHHASREPQTDCTMATWDVCSPQTVGRLLGRRRIFFGRQLHQTLDVPVGMINSRVGGTTIDARGRACDAQKPVAADEAELTMGGAARQMGPDRGAG